MSFIDGDNLPKKYDENAKLTYSGNRIKQGLYQSQNGTFLNADVNGAYNILRKSKPTFSFSRLVEKIRTPVEE